MSSSSIISDDGFIVLFIALFIVQTVVTGGVLYTVFLEYDTDGNSLVEQQNPVQTVPTVEENTSTNALDSVVSIRAQDETGGQIAQGSGFVYESQSGESYIITNQHVVNGGTQFYTVYQDGEWSEMSLIGTDLYTDMAVLKPSTVPEYAEPLSLQTELPRRGQRVLALGSPNDLRGTVTGGIVSGTERSMSTARGFGIPDMIQTDAALNPGNSGGPLVTKQGEVVGVNRARQGENIGYALSSRLAERVANSIIEDGGHDNPLVGIRTTEINPSMENYSRVDPRNGLAVVETVQDSPAAGKLQASNNSSRFSGDIMVSIDGERLKTNEDLASYLLLQTEPGQDVDFTVFRDGVKKNVTVTLGDRPDVSGDS